MRFSTTKGRDLWELSTGRRFQVYSRLLSVDMEEPDRLFYGNDGAVLEIYTGDKPEWDFIDDHPFTPAERQEIAEYMIAQWKAWATPKEEAR